MLRAWRALDAAPTFDTAASIIDLSALLMPAGYFAVAAVSSGFLGVGRGYRVSRLP
jgi:hypothetical protein